MGYAEPGSALLSSALHAPPRLGFVPRSSQTDDPPHETLAAALKSQAWTQNSPTMPLLNAIARLIRKLRGYFRDVHRSREDLTDSLSQENVLPPIPPADGKRFK